MSLAQTPFYVTGGTLRVDAACYVNRQADNDLYDGLKRSEFCYLLNSRQMGKSSLMVRAAARLRQEGVSVVVLDLTAIGQNLTAEQWYGGLLGHVGRHLDLEDELEQSWEEHARLGPLQRWMQAIREIVLARCSGQVVVFVDEIDAVRSLPFSTDEFFAAIRECHNRRTDDAELRRLTFCLIGVATPSDLIRDPRTTPFNIGRRIELCDFTEADAVPLAQGLGREEPLAGELLKRILHWSGGHPYLTQRLCRAVAEDACVVRPASVDRICENLFLSTRARERDDNLLFVRQRILHAEDRAGILDLYEQVRRHKRVRDDETNPRVSELRLAGITRVVEGYLWVRNRIYYRVFDQEWVLANMPDAEKQRQRAAFRRGLLRASAVAAVILALMGGLALSAWRSAQEAKAKARDLAEALSKAEYEHERAGQQEQVANVFFEEARRTVDDFVADIAGEEFRKASGLQSLGDKYAAKAVNQYERFVARRPADLSVAAGLARAHSLHGVIVGQIRNVEGASILERAIAFHQRLVTENPSDRQHRFELAKTRLELGCLCWEAEDRERAKPHVEQAIKELEELLREASDNQEYRYQLARGYNLLGNVQRETDVEEEGEKNYNRSRDLAQRLVQEDPQKVVYLQVLSAPVHNLALIVKDRGDLAQALALFDQSLELDERARALAPYYPDLGNNLSIALLNKADTLAALKRLDEAVKCHELSVETGRAVVFANPQVARFKWLLADNLRKFAKRTPGRRPLPATVRLYEEADRILEDLTRRLPDNALYLASQIESWLDRAEFYEFYASAAEGGAVKRKENQLHCLEQAVSLGRHLSLEFPQESKIQYQAFRALSKRASYAAELPSDLEALPYFREAIELFRTRVAVGPRKPTNDQVSQFLQSAESADACMGRLKEEEDRARLAQLAYDLGKDCTARAGVQSLGLVLNNCGKTHKDAGRYKDAIKMYSQGLRVCEPAFEKETWNWWLRSHVSGQYLNMAACYEKLGDYQNEVLAWRGHLKVWGGPLQGMKIAPYADPKRPIDKAEAESIRKFAKSSPGMKRFTVPCDFAGVKYPFQIYITEVPWPKDPLEDQARWLLVERGGTIPEEVRDSFRRLHKIAHENNVSFQDLCVYALGTAEKEEKKKEKYRQDKEKSLTAILRLKDQVAKSPDNLKGHAELARVYEELARAHLELKESVDAAQAYESCRDRYELLSEKEPANILYRQSLGETCLALSRVLGDLRKFDQAFAACHRHQEVFEDLLASVPSRSDWKDQVQAGFVQLGNLWESKGNVTEAMRCYHLALDGQSLRAAESVATVYTKHPAARVLLPSETQLLLSRAEERARDQRKPLAELFKQQMERTWIAADNDIAEVYRTSAIVRLGQGKKDESLALFEKEMALRLSVVNKKSRDSRLREALGRAECDIAKLHAEESRGKLAVQRMTRAAGWGDDEAITTLAGWYREGTFVKKDPNEALRVEQKNRFSRGLYRYGNGRYADALPDFQKAAELKLDSDVLERLGMCYSKLDRWDEALSAYRKSYVLDKSSRAVPALVAAFGFTASLPCQGPLLAVSSLCFRIDDTPAINGRMCNLLEAYVIAERPGDLVAFVADLEKERAMGRPHVAAAERNHYLALFHAFQAMALHLQGKDATAAERQMRAVLRKSSFKKTDWGWDELDGWLKRTRIDTGRRRAIEQIVAELKAAATSPTSQK